MISSFPGVETPSATRIEHMISSFPGADTPPSYQDRTCDLLVPQSGHSTKLPGSNKWSPHSLEQTLYRATRIEHMISSFPEADTPPSYLDRIRDLLVPRSRHSTELPGSNTWSPRSQERTLHRATRIEHVISSFPGADIPPSYQDRTHDLHVPQSGHSTELPGPVGNITEGCSKWKNYGGLWRQSTIFLWEWWELVVFQSSGWLSFVTMWFCKWLSSKIPFCGYPSFKWDLVGCLDLNTKKNEKKLFQFFKRGLSRKNELCGWWGWLIIWSYEY